MFREDFRIKVLSPHVTVIGHYPSPEHMEHNTKIYNEHYQTLGRAFLANIQVVENPEDAIITDQRPIVVFEEDRGQLDLVPLSTFIHPRDAIYIFGSSKWQYPSDYFEADYHVNIPMNAPIYGNQAAVLMLYDRQQKEIL